MSPPQPPVSTEHGFAASLPLPRSQRRGVALCLSGGGYRAALFHLGAFRRLDELGVLSRVDTFTSVSGGSIALAQLATHRRLLGDAWPEPGEAVPRFDEGVARPLRAFCKLDIRTGTALGSLRPSRWRDENAGVDALARHYAGGPAPGSLAELPPAPRFVFCASDLRFRTQWVFDTGRRRVGSDAAGYAPLDERWTLARAVAASSCLTPAFRAMRVELRPDELRDGGYAERDRAELVRTLHLADGGFYDNLGVEPVWRDHAHVLVSDAAPSLTPVPPFGRLWTWLRIVVTLLEQATDVRKRWLIHGFLRDDLDGAYWGIGALPGRYPDPAVGGARAEGYPDDVIRRLISQVRIDLDAFSDGEIAALENHGYAVADAAVRAHAPELVAEGAPRPASPWPDWLDRGRVEGALARSDRTKIIRPLRIALRLGVGRL